MWRKILVITFFLTLLYSYPALANVQEEWDTTMQESNNSNNLYWDSGFITNGDWALSSNLAFFLKSQLSISESKQEWLGTLSRCYLQFEQGPIRFNTGMQGVSWGVGWFFRPTDLITPLTPLAEEDTRPGKDLATLRWSSSSLTATDVIAGEKTYAVRSEWRIGATNLRVLGVYQPEYINAAGVDFQGTRRVLR